MHARENQYHYGLKAYLRPMREVPEKVEQEEGAEAPFQTAHHLMPRSPTSVKVA